MGKGNITVKTTMSARSANVISLDDYRVARNSQRSTQLADGPLMMPGMMAMAWVPVWFMPVYAVGPSLKAN